MTKRRVVVTGLGLATSLGIDVEDSWQKALKGISGITKLSYASAQRSPVQAVGQIDDDSWLRITDKFKKESSDEGERRTLFALWAADSALRDSGINSSPGSQHRHGVVMAAGLGISRIEDIHRYINTEKKFDYEGFTSNYRNVHMESLIKNNANRPSALIAKKYNLLGYNSTITTACASATQAIGTAYRVISRGDADMIVAGGSDSMINPIGLVFFVLLNAAAVSSGKPGDMCRPFDRKRSGLVMGEGSGVVILESEEHARKRGANIYAEVTGYGTTMDAFKVTAPDPDGRGAEQSMLLALQDASMPVEQVDYINAHGTSTKLNDATETKAIKNVFGEHAYRLSVNSSKSLIGHLLAASGGPELIFTVLSVKRDQIHPTINLENPDPKCDLDYVANTMKKKRVRAALSNSFGFGGQNASIIVKKYSEESS